MVKKAKKVGRPKMSNEDKQKYSRLATYPSTHEKLLRLKEKSGHKYLIDYLQELVDNVPEDNPALREIEQ